MKEKSRKDIIIIITYIGLVIFALVNFDKVTSLVKNVFSVLSPFIGGVVFAFVLNVLCNFIDKRLFSKLKPSNKLNKIKKPFCITMSLVTVFLIFIFIINLLIPQLRNSLSLFISSMPEYKEDIVGILEKFNVEDNTINVVEDYLDNFGKSITKYLKDNSENVIMMTTEVLGSIISVISKTLISVVFAIYILIEKDNLSRQVHKIMRVTLKEKTIDKINNIAIQANTTFSNFVSCQCLEAVIFGSLCFFSMLIFRMPYALPIAVLLGFTALIPIFGAFIGTGLGFILIFMVSPIKAFIFVIVILIIQQIENNLIYPKVVGKSIGLPGIWVLFSVTVGGNLGGMLGLIIATPLCSLIYALVSATVNEKIKIIDRQERQEEVKETV